MHSKKNSTVSHGTAIGAEESVHDAEQLKEAPPEEVVSRWRKILANHFNGEEQTTNLEKKVLLKMAEEQTLKVVERECAKERNARDASMKKMKQYADLIHEKITTREREAAAERQVQRSMIQVLARTRRALNKLHEQVMNNQGDLEEVRSPFHCDTSCKNPIVSHLQDVVLLHGRFVQVRLTDATCLLCAAFAPRRRESPRTLRT